MTAKERYLFLFIVIVVGLTAIYNSANAADWDYYYEPVEVYNIYSTLPGTNIRDYSRPGHHIEIDRYGNREVYSTLPGTDIRDYSRPGYRIDRR